MALRVIRTTVGLALSVAGLVVLVPAPSLAAQPLQTHTLSCDDGTEVVLTVVEGNAFDVADATSTFVVMSGSVVLDGVLTVIQRPNGTQRTRDLVTCTFTNTRGDAVIVSGFYTPTA